MEIDGLHIEVERKPIKHLHLSVYPPDGHVHLSMPKDLTDEDARLFIIAKWSWIKRQREDIENQPRQTLRQYISGENYYLFGERYMLNVKEIRITPQIKVKGNQLYMYVWPNSTHERREELMREWYRVRLQKLLSPMVDEWAERLDEKNFTWQVQKMLNRWGSCTVKSRFIRFNLDLARVPRQCIEYIVVHELTHLKVAKHNKMFEMLLDKRMPDWRKRREELNNFIALPMVRDNNCKSYDARRL